MPDPAPSAISLFADYLGALDAGAHLDFEEWVAKHPSQERELRALRNGDLALEGYVSAERVGQTASAGSSEPTSFFGPGHVLAAPAVFQGTFDPGDRIGDFQLLEPLGSGGMGQVWKATQMSLNRAVALKLVRPGRISPDTLERFAREARAGGRLSHPAIVAIHGFGESDGVHWIAMELVQDGWTLRGFIDRMRTLKELPRDYYPEVAALVADLADALQAAHEANVIHRDIKPQNILITPQDRPKLTDFGLARITDEAALTRTGELAGTYLYMSPEQVAAGRMGIDHRTDIFSLGVVLYELLGLLRPFEGDTTHQIAAKILTEEPPDLRAVRSRVPRDLAVIAGKALEKDRDERYQSMAELAADLRRHLANEAVHARAPGTLRRARKWIERHPTRSVAAALLAFGLAGTGITSVWAVQNAAQARAERDRVFGLVASEDLRRLNELASSDELWPAVPAMATSFEGWLAEARAVTDGLPEHKAVLAELRQRGTPVGARPGGPSPVVRVEIARARGLRDAERRAQEVRRGERFPELGSDAPITEASGVEGLLRAAWKLVGPGRVQFEDEERGFELALAALEAGPGELDSLAFQVWCEAALAVGLESQVLVELEPFAEQLEGPAAASFALFAAGFVPRAERAEELADERILALERQITALEAGSREPTEWQFADDKEDRWFHEHLAQLVADIERFADPIRGPVHGSAAPFGWGVERRQRWAEGVLEASLASEAARAAWSAAVTSIADVRACPRYEGLEIEPQLGLLPIGRDPDSGLWEFACLSSGEPAERDERGHVRRSEEMGIVLVLIPGGEYGHERVEPFFLSKYEMTQAQWERAAIENPSTFTNAGEEPGITPLNPVETVSWNECSHVVRSLGLELPSEQRWRYAADWKLEPLPANAAPSEPRESANLADAGPGITIDGFRVHAPVGCFPADGFGLHDMRGNVSEWCADVGEEAPASAAVSAEPPRLFLGSHWAMAHLPREVFRFSVSPSFSSSDRGLRPARSLVKPGG